MGIRPVDPPRPVDDASTQYSHGFGFVGSAAAESMDPGSNLKRHFPPFEELDGYVVGFSVRKERDLGISAHVYLLRSSDLGDRSIPDLVASTDGVLPVIEIELDRNLTIGELLDSSFNRFSFVASSVVDDAPLKLEVVAEASIDE